jgi:hypothetical protein
MRPIFYKGILNFKGAMQFSTTSKQRKAKEILFWIYGQGQLTYFALQSNTSPHPLFLVVNSSLQGMQGMIFWYLIDKLSKHINYIPTKHILFTLLRQELHT